MVGICLAYATDCTCATSSFLTTAVRCPTYREVGVGGDVDELDVDLISLVVVGEVGQVSAEALLGICRQSYVDGPAKHHRLRIGVVQRTAQEAVRRCARVRNFPSEIEVAHWILLDLRLTVVRAPVVGVVKLDHLGE